MMNYFKGNTTKKQVDRFDIKTNNAVFYRANYSKRNGSRQKLFINKMFRNLGHFKIEFVDNRCVVISSAVPK